MEVKRLNSDLDLLYYNSKSSIDYFKNNNANVIYAPKIKHKFYKTDLSPISPLQDNAYSKQNSSTIIKKIDLLSLEDKLYKEPEFIVRNLKRKPENDFSFNNTKRIIISSKKDEEDFQTSDQDIAFSDMENDSENNSCQDDPNPNIVHKVKATTILEKLEEVHVYSLHNKRPF